MFSPDPRPQLLEHPGRPGEVDAGQLRVGQHHLGDLRAVPGQHVDHPGGSPASVQQVHDQRRGQLLGDRRLPDHHVAHQGRRGRQVAGDGGEVERGDRVDEPLQRPVVGAVPDPLGVGHRLLVQDLPGEMHVEPPEVGQLAGRIDLGLVRRLRLAEHGRGVHPGPPGTGQQFGGAQQDRRPGVEVQRPPVVGRVQRGLRPPSAASAWVEFAEVARTRRWSKGATTWNGSPDGRRLHPADHRAELHRFGHRGQRRRRARPAPAEPGA